MKQIDTDYINFPLNKWILIKPSKKDTINDFDFKTLLIKVKDNHLGTDDKYDSYLLIDDYYPLNHTFIQNRSDSIRLWYMKNTIYDNESFYIIEDEKELEQLKVLMLL